VLAQPRNALRRDSKRLRQLGLAVLQLAGSFRERLRQLGLAVLQLAGSFRERADAAALRRRTMARAYSRLMELSHCKDRFQSFPEGDF
jgi:hypothetical protein